MHKDPDSRALNLEVRSQGFVPYCVTLDTEPQSSGSLFLTLSVRGYCKSASDRLWSGILAVLVSRFSGDAGLESPVEFWYSWPWAVHRVDVGVPVDVAGAWPLPSL